MTGEESAGRRCTRGQGGAAAATDAMAVPIWTQDDKHAVVEHHGEQGGERGEVRRSSSAAGTRAGIREGDR
jgi:hypothetical protein